MMISDFIKFLPTKIHLLILGLLVCSELCLPEPTDSPSINESDNGTTKETSNNHQTKVNGRKLTDKVNIEWAANNVSIFNEMSPHNRRSAMGFGKVQRRWEGRIEARRIRRKMKSLKRPNIVFILTDDQDTELGSMNFMPKTLKILAEEGAHFPNAFVTTPMCCPSRSSILTGLYSHNHNVHTNNDNCSSPQWQATHEPRTFATHLHDAGYRTAFFGKYLNEYNGLYIPPGWREWFALVRNSRFYNYTLNVNGKKVRHGDNYALDYYPDLIINDSLSFFRKSKKHFPDKPVMMMLSFPSPHGPEEAAPQYQNLFHNVTTHRTPSWNYAPNPDKQWLLRNSPKMQQIHMDFTDMLHTRRLQTLQSVDDAIERLYKELKRLKELDNTYIFYSSDHGYHLGQFGLLKGKSMPFEFDVRVPFYVRGPWIPRGSTISEIVLNIDIAPTFLDIAGVPVPEYIDGKSVFNLLTNFAGSPSLSGRGLERKKRRKWRDTFLIERGKMAGETEEGKIRFHKKKWLETECQKSQYASPCGPNQEWECLYDESGLRMRKCRRFRAFGAVHDKNVDCPCSDSLTLHHRPRMHHAVRRRGDTEKLEAPHFPSLRSKREAFNVDRVYGISRLLDSAVSLNNSQKTGKNSVLQFHEESGCFLYTNHSILCPNEVYKDKEVWLQRKNAVDNSILKLQIDLDRLKGIKRHLRRRRPVAANQRCECEENNINQRIKLRELRRQSYRKRMRKMKRKGKFANTNCNLEKMNCFTHDDNHWKTPPLWTKGSFCFCQNANNNTFWCLRTINSTHNYLYCEFITGFLTYYDLKQDPYQLSNAIFSLDWSVLKKLRQKLNALRNCSGYRNCNSQWSGW